MSGGNGDNETSNGEGPDLQILDGADGDLQQVRDEVSDQHEVAADTELGLEERLEAYEDIVDSQVGDTSMVRARNIERRVGLRQVFLKFEGGNPTGTQKDRIAFAQAMDAMRRGYDAVTVATCGNYGVAMAFAAHLAGLRCIVFLPELYHTKRLREISELGVEVRRVPGDYETTVDQSRAFADEAGCYDANPGGENTPIQLQAYGEIAREIFDELRDAPFVVAIPVSNGTTLAGVYRGFLSLYRRGKTSRMPRMVAGSSYRKNPIIQAFLRGKPACEDLEPRRIHETATNEPLINWRAIDGDPALAAIRATNGWASNATDRTMRSFSRLIGDSEGLNVLPASTAGLIALVEAHQKETLPGDRYVTILTGRKS